MTTPPTIVLANNGAIQIVRDSDEYNNFNPLDYVLSCSDNYDENPLLSFAPTRLVADEQTSDAKIDFSAVDTANNRTSATLTVFSWRTMNLNYRMNKMLLKLRSSKNS